MNILAVDDERPALMLLKNAIEDALPDCTPMCFLSSKEAVEYARTSPPDVAFLDVQIDEMNGLQLAGALLQINGRTDIIFVTGYDQYATEAFRLHASGYLLKPVNAQSVLHEIENLRYPVVQRNEGVQIHTFGRFDVYVEDRLLYFRRSKAKEILAYLINRRGAAVSRRELARLLWEDEPYSRRQQDYLQKLIREMMKTLNDAGAGGIVKKTRAGFAIDVDKVDCDYYRYLDWDAGAVNQFHGEYMVEYAWAEFTIGMLVRDDAR